MARDITIGQTQTEARIRSPWAVALLTVVTLGIYALVWYYKVNREMRDLGASAGDSELAESRPVRSILAVTIGAFLVIPPFVSYVRTLGRLRRVEELTTGIATGGRGVSRMRIAIVLALCLRGLVPTAVGQLVGAAMYLVVIALIQRRLNSVWAAHAGGERCVESVPALPSVAVSPSPAALAR
jgi:hypothetical protein